MPGIIGPTWGEVGSSDMDLDAIPSTTGERVDPLDTLHLMARSSGDATAELGTVDDYGRQVSAPEPPVDADALNDKWGIKGSTPETSLTFNGPLPESVAQDMNAAKRDEIMRASAGQRSPGGVGSALGDFGFGMLDPVGIAASAMPVFGEARIAAMLGRAGLDLGEGVAGRIAGRAVTGAVDATTANLPLVGMRYGLSQQEQSDYSMTDAARDLAFGSLLGGVLHPAIGAVSDALHGFVAREPGPAALDQDPQTRGAMMTAGVAAAMEDRPFDAGPFGDLALARSEQEGLWVKLSHDSDALQSEIGDVRDTPAPDPATDARLSAIQDELETPDLTAERRAELAQETSMLTEGAQPTPESDALFAARSQSQREGLQAALERNRQRITAIEQTIYQSDMARRASGLPSIEDATTLRQAGDAAKAAPSKPGEAPSDAADQIAKLEADIERTRSGGVPTAEEEGRSEAMGQAAQPGDPDITQGVAAEKPAKGNAYTQQPKEPMRLINFLRKKTVLFPGTIHETVIPGGVRDHGGDVSAILGGNKGGLINNKSGRGLDDAAVHAWEAGYFPEHDHPRGLDINQLLDKIAEDRRGNPQYSMNDQDAVAAYNEAMEHNAEIEKFSAQTGIDPQGKTRAQFWDAVSDHISAEQAAEDHMRMEGEQSAAFDAFERAAKDHAEDTGEPWNADEFYGKSQPRSLFDIEFEDLEREYAEEQSAPTAQQRTGGDEQPGLAGQPAGAGEDGVRQDGRADGATGRDGAEGGAGSADTAATERPTGVDAPRLDPEYEAELQTIADAEQASHARANAFLQAGACVARGFV